MIVVTLLLMSNKLKVEYSETEEHNGIDMDLYFMDLYEGIIINLSNF